MSDVLIVAALESRLFTVPGLPDAAHRALENTPYEPTAGEAWLRVSHRWGNEVLRTLPAAGGRITRSGFMQVDLFLPLVPTGGGSALHTLIDAVRAAFPAGAALVVGGGVMAFYIRETRRWGAQRDRLWWWDHVDVHWEAVVTNPTF